MRKTRLLITLGSLELGGTERNALHLAQRLDRDRFDVEVWSLYEQGPLFEAFRQAGVE